MKLTLVSINFRGCHISRFIQCEVVNGKTIMNQSTLDEMLAQAGVRRGDTYTFA